MDTFFRTHQYLVKHIQSPIRRKLMDEIDWSSRLIGIKGTRGVGKTTFLLQYAKENFDANSRECLYINMNHLYFTCNSLEDFALEFSKRGGKVLIIDQIFKYPNWSEALYNCYHSIPKLKIVFSASSAMKIKEENPLLSEIVDSYFLRGFSFREYVNLKTGLNLNAYSFDEIRKNHVSIASFILEKVNPIDYFSDYLHHGFYPFFLEKRNYSENLLKVVNLMIEGDIFFLKDIQVSNFHKIRKLLYELSNQYLGQTPNISQLSIDIDTSRATVMNYIKYLKDARLINMLYSKGDDFPKKPKKIYLHNSNLLYPLLLNQVDDQAAHETFFYNCLFKDNKLHFAPKGANFLINGNYLFFIDSGRVGRQTKTDIEYYVKSDIMVGRDNVIPLWLWGFLY